MGYHGIEIAIIMEQSQSFHNAESRYHYIDCFSYSNTSFSKASVILSTLNGDIVSTDLAKREGTKEVLGCFVIVICSETLKDLRENQIPNDDGNIGEAIVKQVGLPRGNAVEIIDPHG